MQRMGTVFPDIDFLVDNVDINLEHWREKLAAVLVQASGGP